MTGRQDDPHEPADNRFGDAADDLDAGPGILARGRDLAGLSVAGITRRRIALLLTALLSAWIVLALSRQVGDAADAANRANQLTRDNQAITAQIQTLSQERTLIQEQAYIEIEARAHGLGGRQEHAFTLAADAPALPPDAPGSASGALGAAPSRAAPIDAWLDLLFGAGH